MKLTDINGTMPHLPTLVEVAERCSFDHGAKYILKLWDVQAHKPYVATTTDPAAAKLEVNGVMRLARTEDGSVHATPVNPRQLSWKECWQVVTGHGYMQA